MTFKNAHLENKIRRENIFVEFFKLKIIWMIRLLFFASKFIGKCSKFY